MADRPKTHEEKDCIIAFTSGKKRMAEQLLPRIIPAVVRTTFQSPQFSIPSVVGMVSLLHLAAFWGWKDICQLLVTVYKCSAKWRDNEGYIPLHYATFSGHLEVVRYLTSGELCNPMDTNKNDRTSLHIACREGHLGIVRYLVSEANCDPVCKINDGRTPLHFASMYNHADIVEYLLSTGRVNPLAENKNGDTPLFLATGKYDIIKLFQPFIDCSRDYPVHTFTKLILTGDSGAGKTTIAQLIILLAQRSSLNLDCVVDVERFTAGIIPHQVESEMGNFVIYDFAGQQEYYSSHAAILEQVMRRSAAMFLCLIDLSKSNERICQSLQYWLTFIENACNTAKGTSHVAVIGSHVDQVRSTDEMEEKSSLLNTIAVRRVKRQEYAGLIMMDCRRAATDTNTLHQLIQILTNSQKVITARQPAISYYCHVLYAFLRTKLKAIGCTLQDLMSDMAKENDSSLPNNLSVLTELLTTLSDKGLILFIQHSQSNNWVIVKTEILLNEINGTLFAPFHFKEYCDLSSNTGIVSTSTLSKVFPQHNPEMLLGFFMSLDFCRPVDPSVFQCTNLQTVPSHSTTDHDLLFFPGLVQSERPESLTQLGTLQFGWCLGCLNPNQFFGSRFLHLLLLLIAYQFPLASRRSFTPFLRKLQRRCSVWKNGISWRDSDNITTVVELIDKNRWVLVAMSCSQDRPVEHAKLRSALISLVRNLHQERCPSLEMCECLISPSLIKQYPLDDLPDTDLFDIQDVAMSILLRKPFIPSHNEDCIGHLPTQSLPLEPYHLISPSSVCQLFNSSLANQPVPVSLLHKIREFCHQPKIKPQVYKELRNYMDSLSIFAGRNLLVRAMCRGGMHAYTCL